MFYCLILFPKFNVDEKQNTHYYYSVGGWRETRIEAIKEEAIKEEGQVRERDTGG